MHTRTQCAPVKECVNSRLQDLKFCCTVLQTLLQFSIITSLILCRSGDVTSALRSFVGSWSLHTVNTIDECRM